jgi:hypothetical protein
VTRNATPIFFITLPAWIFVGSPASLPRQAADRFRHCEWRDYDHERLHSRHSIHMFRHSTHIAPSRRYVFKE